MRSEAVREIWIHSSYNPATIRAAVVIIVKQAADITSEKLNASDTKSVFDAIQRGQSAIEFTPDGTVVIANDNF